MTKAETKQTTAIEVIANLACAFICIGFGEPDRAETPELCRTAIEYLTNAEPSAMEYFDSRTKEAIDSEANELPKEISTDSDIKSAISELIHLYADENEPQDKRTHMLRTAILIAVFYSAGTNLAEELAVVLKV